LTLIVLRTDIFTLNLMSASHQFILSVQLSLLWLQLLTLECPIFHR